MTADTTARPSTAVAGRPRRRRRRRALRATAIVVVALAATGFLAQTVLEWRDGRAWPPPGELVDVGGGRQLHLVVTGEEHEGPTVVLEAGAGGFSPPWAWVQQQLSAHATVVSYDRAGFGWSDPAGGEIDGTFFTADLRAALDARGLNGPYVLVGHSFGGLLIRAFAASDPDEVAGMVFVDSTHEDVYEERENVAAMRRWRRLVRAVAVANRLGALRIHNPMGAEFAEGLPAKAYDQTVARQLRGAYFRAVDAEYGAVEAVAEHVAAGGDLGDIPIRVLSAEHNPALERLQPKVARLSSESRHEIVPGSGHVTIITEQAHAEAVAGHVIELLEGP